MRRTVRVLLWVGGIYAATWAFYVVKSAAGFDLIAYDAPLIGGHHGAWFPGSDPLVAVLRHL